jgi:hypothetical protein
VAEWELVIRGFLCPVKSIEEQDLISGIHNGVDSFGKHGRASRNGCGDKFGDGDQKVADKGSDDDLLGAGGSHRDLPGFQGLERGRLSASGGDRAQTAAEGDDVPFLKKMVRKDKPIPWVIGAFTVSVSKNRNKRDPWSP